MRSIAAVTTDLTPTERLFAGWRSSHFLHGSYYPMSDVLKNAAGVPLVLIATPAANGGVAVDYSQVPVTTFDPALVATLPADSAQALMDSLVAKYDGVTCTMAEGHDQVEGLNEDQFTMGADWPYVEALTARGADRVLAHQHLADAKGLVHTGAPSSAPTETAPTDENHGEATLKDGGPTLEEYVKAGYDPSTYPPAGYKAVAGTERIAPTAPVHNGPLTLTVEQHAQAKSRLSALWEHVDEEGEALLHEVAALLRHVI